MDFPLHQSKKIFDHPSPPLVGSYGDCRTMHRVLICLILAYALIFFACSNSSQQPPVEKRVAVKVAAVARGSITSYVHVSGTTQPLQQAKIGSKVEGIVKEILADEGSVVKKNQVLLRLDPVEFILALNQARAALKQAECDLVQQANDWSRISTLYERRIVAKNRYDSMQAAYETAKARVEENRAVLALAQHKYEDSVVHAPFDGVITAKMMHEGEVSSLWAYKWQALEIMDLSSVKLECDVSEKLKAQLHKGMQAEIKMDAFPGDTFTGRIATVNPVVEPAQRTFRIKIVIPNPEQKLTAGMFARVRIALSRKDNVLIIPAAEILERPDGHFIFIIKDGAAEQRRITLGDREEKIVEVVDGVKQGDVVVIEGSYRLQNGYKVDIRQ
jgi:membrane fusion protein, multidrug efflux system